MKTFALASSSLFLFALVSGCPAPANTGEGEGEGEGQTAGEGEGEGVAGEGEGEGVAGEGEGEGGEGEGEGEGEGTPITVTADTPATENATFTGTGLFEQVCYSFVADNTAIYTMATTGACAGTSGTPQTDVDMTDDAGDDFFQAGVDSPTANCGEVQGQIAAGQNVTACVFNGDGGAGQFTVTISEEQQQTIADGGQCNPNDIAQVCDTATNANEACLFDGTQHICAVQTTLNPNDPCIATATTQVCDPAQNLACLDGGGGNFSCQNPDAVRCTAPVDFGSSSGGANLFIGQATNLNSAENTCGTTDGNDLVLQYTIQGDNSIVTFEGLGVNSIAVRTTCADPTTEASCASGAGSPASGQGTVGTTLFVLIDADPSASEVVVQATESPLLNGGDTCDAAVALPSASGSLSASNTTGFTDASDLPTNNACTGFDTPGPDEFYSITIPAGQTLTASMDPTGFDASLYVIDKCPFDATADIAHCLVGSDHSGTEHISYVNNTGADQNVFIVADVFSSSATGTYTLTWSVQ